MLAGSLMERGWKTLFHPTIRLKPDFPLTGLRLGKVYGIAVLWSTVGSLLPVVLFALYGFSAALIGRLGYIETQNYLWSLVSEPKGNIRDWVQLAVVISSFVVGFGVELWYYSRVLRRSGHTLFGSVGLHLGPALRNTWLGTLWAITWPAVVVMFFVQCGESLLASMLTVPEQPTVAYAKSLSGGEVWLFFVLAAVLAPLMEEVVFRGILFQALRSTFFEWKVAAAAEVPPTGILKVLTTYLGATVFATSARVDLVAVVLSSAMFSVGHLQFEPALLLLLFGMGVVLSELFRRTGTLWTGILLHALCNGLTTLAIIYAA